MSNTTVEPVVTDPVFAISHRVRCDPAYVVHGNAGDNFYAANWRFPAHRVSAECLTSHILCCLMEGSQALGKIANGRAIRRRAHPGAISLLVSGEFARYTIDGECTVLQVYISPAFFREFCEQQAPGGRPASLQPFFVVDDPWLKAYFEMLASEVAMYGERACELDSLLLSQSQQLLFGHLLRRYGDLNRRDLLALDRPSRHRPLRPLLLKRVTDFVHAHIGDDIRLADLAELVHLSQRHFIRAFYAATGVTPYQYVVEKRLQACAERLLGDADATIAEIAKAMGFKSQAHFAAQFRARYGIAPTRYRDLNR
ncbi:MAG: helix-turn-helix domain-containing protein [Sulfurifustaceae bacterium]